MPIPDDPFERVDGEDSEPSSDEDRTVLDDTLDSALDCFLSEAPAGPRASGPPEEATRPGPDQPAESPDFPVSPPEPRLPGRPPDAPPRTAVVARWAARPENRRADNTVQAESAFELIELEQQPPDDDEAEHQPIPPAAPRDTARQATVPGLPAGRRSQFDAASPIQSPPPDDAAVARFQPFRVEPPPAPRVGERVHEGNRGPGQLRRETEDNQSRLAAPSAPVVEHHRPKLQVPATIPASPSIGTEVEPVRPSWRSRLQDAAHRLSDGQAGDTPGWTSRTVAFGFSAAELAVGALVIIAVIEAALLAWPLLGRGGGPSGTVTLTSRPAGAQLLVDGEAHGATPATLRLREGLHTLEIRSRGPAQVMALRMARGAELAHFVDLPDGTAAAALRVDTQPSGARVLVDGRPRGYSPVSVAGLNPGRHVVRVERGSQWFESAVTLEPGVSGALALPLEASSRGPGEGRGWLTFSSSTELRIYEDAQLVGTTRSGPVALPAGRRTLRFVNSLVGIDLARSVDVLAGQPTEIDLAIPAGLLSIEASAAAEILVDGESVGFAPIVNRPLPPGQHDVVAVHPQLGERRLMVTLAAGAPLSVFIDFSR